MNIDQTMKVSIETIKRSQDEIICQHLLSKIIYWPFYSMTTKSSNNIIKSTKNFLSYTIDNLKIHNTIKHCINK